MSKKLRWGILGTGNIASQFSTGVSRSERGILAAVGSRTDEKAKEFAGKFGIAETHGSYEALIESKAVDAVYVSLPNSMHHEWTLKAIAAGKHVLCEKPLATNAQQAEEMFDAAERAGVVLMEAFMYRSHPLTLAVQEVVNAGTIGEVRLIRTSFCYRTTKIAGNVRFSAELAGGAIMDIGCYCVSFSRLFAGNDPVEIKVSGQLHESGVDQFAAGVLRFPGDVLGSFTCGMNVQADNSAYICGSEGYVIVPVPWKPPGVGATFTIARGTPPKMDGGAAKGPPPKEIRTVDAGGELYGIEADDFVAACFGERPVRVTRADSVGNMRVLDEARRQIGVNF